MKIIINCGHTKMGKGTGANGFLNESYETRKVGYELVKLLSQTKHEVLPITIDKSDNYLKEVVDLTNKAKADLFISIHLNAGKGKGTEVFTYKGNQHKEALAICKNYEKLGFKNRGVKDGTKFYVVAKTTCKALLIEICFVDTIEDAELYKKLGTYQLAKAIYDAIV